MPALDPFSASSRPMRPFDSLPSEPLRFAATLRPIDQNADPAPSPSSSNAGADALGSVHKLPKPKKYKDTIPKEFPASPFLHSRHASFDFREVSLAIGHSEPRVQVGSDEWMQHRVAQCVDSAKGVLDLKNLGLTSLSTRIADMRDLVTLPSSFSPRASSSNAPVTASRAVPGDPSSPIFRSPSPHLSPALSPGSGPLSANSRSFTRVVSAPASSLSFSSALNLPRTSLGRTPSGLGSSVVTYERQGEGAGGANSPASSLGLLDSPSDEAPVPQRPVKRQISRSKTGAVAFGSPRQAISSSSVEILVAGNMLSSLPTVLFEISNLTLLSLRGNRLKSLPAAIGQLLNLRDLNISNNDIKELPSTILNLNLTSFHAHPNAFYRKLQQGQDEKESPNAVATIKAPSDRILGPLTRLIHDGSVPRLYDICLNLLISPRPPSNLPPLLDQYEWEAPARGQRHPLLDVDVLADIIPSIPKDDMRRALQALKSAGHSYGSPGISQTHHYGAAPGLSSKPSTRVKVDPFPRSHRPSPPDDASENPYYSPCPSPRHFEFEAGQDEKMAMLRPTRHLFINAAEERLEWRTVFDVDQLPIRWRGCSPGCLAFLEEAEEDWGLDEEDEEGDHGGVAAHGWPGGW